MSAYAHLSGPFDYNKMPLAPMGCEAQVHEKTDKRSTWAYHSVDGWYLFTSPEHYRTHNCHIKHTKSERLSDTVQFQHKRITNDAHIGRLRQSAIRHDKQRQKFSGSPRPPPNHRGSKSPRTSTTRSPRGNRNTFYHPKHATSSEGTNTQHVTSSEGANASKGACNQQY